MPTTTRKPTRSYTVRKPSVKKPTKRASVARPRKPARKVYGGLPGWKELSDGNARRPSSGKGSLVVERVSTLRFAILVLLAATLFTLYVGHVHATQDLLADVQQMRRENLNLHLKYNRVKGEYDRMIGPQVIYERARELGLEEGFAYGPSIMGSTNEN